MCPRTKEQYAEIRSSATKSIAHSAMRLFMEYGYLNVTIDQIAREAKVSKGLMYNYFSGKEDLLSFIIDQILKEMHVFSEHILQEKDPVKKMVTLIKASFRLMKEKSDFWKTIMPLITQKAISSKLEAKLRGMFMAMTKDLEKMFRACGVKNPGVEAYQLGALLDGIAWHYFFLFKGDYPLGKMEKELITKYSKLLENGK